MDERKTAEFKLEKKSVNSKALCEDVQEDVEELISEAGVLWGNDTHRQGFVETIDDILAQIADPEDGRIEQWNVICDLRNNTIAQMDKGIYVLEIAYKQKNCLNTTRLVYTIKDLLISSLKDLIDFQIAP